MGQKDGYVFTKTNGEKYTGDYFSKRFKRACRAADMDKAIHFHSLRHSFASNLAQRGSFTLCDKRTAWDIPRFPQLKFILI